MTSMWSFIKYAFYTTRKMSHPLGDVKLLVVILPSLFGHVTGNAIGNLYTFSPYLSFR